MLIANELVTLQRAGEFKQCQRPARERTAFLHGMQIIERQVVQSGTQIRPVWAQHRQQRPLPAVLRATLLDDVLPIFDNLYLSAGALWAAPTLMQDHTLRDLLDLALTTFLSLLKPLGIAPVEPIGERFDPRHHEAVQVVERSDLPGGTIAQVVRPGFLLEQTPLRAARVLVAGVLQKRP